MMLVVQRTVRAATVLVQVAIVAAMVSGLTSCGDSAPDQGPPPSISEVNLLRAEPEEAALVWHTSVPTVGEVRLGTSRENLSRTYPVRANTTAHRAVLDSLTRGTTYYCMIVARTSRGSEVTSDVIEFATPNEAAPVVVAPAGDNGYDVATITTVYGDIVIRFLEDVAPAHSANFKRLASDRFYDGTTFHRVVPGFMIQGGDPNSKDQDPENDGRGGPGYTLEAELGGRHIAGAVAAARLGGPGNPTLRSNGSQFYICVAPQQQLDGQYTVFGQVVRGLDVVYRIVRTPRDQRNDRPYMPMTIERVRVRRVREGEEP